MNKQELIERMKSLKNLFGNKSEYIEIDTVIKLAFELDEPQKPVVPQFVADWIEKCKSIKQFITSLAYALNSEVWSENSLSDECIDWLYKAGNQDIFARAWLYGYEIEKEKQYTVKMKGILAGKNFLNHRIPEEIWSFSSKTESTLYKTKHTRKELENSGFGWVFDCPGVEVKEVEE